MPESISTLCDPQQHDLTPLRARLLLGEWCREFKHQLSFVGGSSRILLVSHRLGQAFQRPVVPVADNETGNRLWHLLFQCRLTPLGCPRPLLP